MAITYKILGQAAPANNSNVTVYTVPTGKQAILSSITFVTGDTSNKTLRIHALKAGQSVGNGVNTIYYINALTVGTSSYQFTDKITLGEGESIGIWHNTAGEASSVITIFGTEMDI